jgi:nucleotide-binding universal stress UspA family protein
MFGSILVCLDGSKLAEQVLPYVTDTAKAFKSKVVLFTAFPLPVIVSPAFPGEASVPVQTKGMVAEAIKNQRAAAAYLVKIAARLKEAGVAAETVTQEGMPGPAIVGYAEAQKIALIAMVTHGHGGLERAILGSTADYVLREATVPVLTVRPEGYQSWRKAHR